MIQAQIQSNVFRARGLAGGGGGTIYPTPTGFQVSSNIKGTLLSAGWFLPAPAHVTGAEVWTSTDGVTYSLFSTVAPPTANQNFAALAVGTFQWTKIRWTDGAGGFSPFTAPIQYSGQAMDWAARVTTNTTNGPGALETSGANAMWCTLHNAGIDSLMQVVNVCAYGGGGNPSPIGVLLTPFLKGAGTDPWTSHNSTSVNATINGYADASTGWLYTGFLGTNFPSDSDSGVTVYDIQGTSEAAAYVAGAYNSGDGLSALQTNNAGNSTASLHSLANRLSVTAPNAGGMFSMNRVAANDLRLFWGNSTNPYAQVGATSAAAAGTRPAIEMYFGALGLGNPAGTLFTAHTLSFCAFHHGLTLAQATTLFNAVQAMRTTMGGGFV